MPDPVQVTRLIKRTGLPLPAIAELTGYSLRTVYRWERGQSLPRQAVMDQLRQLGPRSPTAAPGNGAFTFVDLFAGIGGFRMAFEKMGGRCVFTSEWDPACQKTYKANFSDSHPFEGDIREVPETEIPPHDILLAGFPCQPFSIAGVSKKNALGQRHGFACEAQGTLFFDIVRIIKACRPRAFLLENVKNLRSHDGGKTYATILQLLQNRLGYHVSDAVINARSLVPQNRERIFIVGLLEDRDFDLGQEVQVPDPSKGPTLSAVLHPENGTEKAEEPYTHGPDARVSPRYTLSQHLWTYLKDYAARHRALGNGFGYGLVGPEDVARTLSARYFKDGSEILVRQPRRRPRRLTPRECARLMGFDRTGRDPFRIPVSDTQAYRQFGNAVVVPVVEAVAKAILPRLLGQAAVPSRSHSQRALTVG